MHFSRSNLTILYRTRAATTVKGTQNTTTDSCWPNTRRESIGAISIDEAGDEGERPEFDSDHRCPTDGNVLESI